MPLTQAELDALARKPKSASGDAGSVESRDADDVLKLAGLSQGENELTGTNPQGGPRSAWKLMRRAQFSPGGGH